MRVYVAGGFPFKDEIRAVQTAVRDAGHIITHDWTEVEEGLAPTPADLARYSVLDLDGVRTADAVLVCFSDPAYPYRGTFAELAAALALGKRVVILDRIPGFVDDAGVRRVPFYHDPGATVVKQLDEALGALTNEPAALAGEPAAHTLTRLIDPPTPWIVVSRDE